MKLFASADANEEVGAERCIGERFLRSEWQRSDPCQGHSGFLRQGLDSFLSENASICAGACLNEHLLAPVNGLPRQIWPGKPALDSPLVAFVDRV